VSPRGFSSFPVESKTLFHPSLLLPPVFVLVDFLPFFGLWGLFLCFRLFFFCVWPLVFLAPLLFLPLHKLNRGSPHRFFFFPLYFPWFFPSVASRYLTFLFFCFSFSLCFFFFFFFFSPPPGGAGMFVSVSPTFFFPVRGVSLFFSPLFCFFFFVFQWPFWCNRFWGVVFSPWCCSPPPLGCLLAPPSFFLALFYWPNFWGACFFMFPFFSRPSGFAFCSQVGGSF